MLAAISPVALPALRIAATFFLIVNKNPCQNVWPEQTEIIPILKK